MGDNPGMDTESLRRAIETRFGCRCSVTLRPARWRRPARLEIVYDTDWLPRTWERFVAFDDSTSAAIREILSEHPGAKDMDTEVVHAARRLRKRLLPIGPDGIIEIDDPPTWFARTGQDALFHRERHTGKRFRL